MAKYKVRSNGIEHTVNVVDSSVGGATVTIEGCEETFEVEFLSGTGAEVAAANAGAAQPLTASLGASIAPQPVPVAAPPVAGPSAAPAALPRAATAPAAVGKGAVVAPIPGKIVSIDVAVGDAVELNQLLLKLEAMKMENNVAASMSGIVQSIEVAAGDEVRDGQLLVVIG